MQIDFEQPMPPWLLDILGRPNFACGQIAEQLRRAGEPIPRKAEPEQAAVIWWLLRFANRYGEGWREPAADELRRLIREFSPPEHAAPAEKSFPPPTAEEVRLGKVGHHGRRTDHQTVECGHCKSETPIEDVRPTPSVICIGCRRWVRVDG